MAYLREAALSPVAGASVSAGEAEALKRLRSVVAGLRMDADVSLPKSPSRPVVVFDGVMLFLGLGFLVSGMAVRPAGPVFSLGVLRAGVRRRSPRGGQVRVGRPIDEAVAGTGVRPTPAGT